VAKIKHTRNENGRNFTHQNKTTLFWRKKAKINLHQNFPGYVIKFVSDFRQVGGFHQVLRYPPPIEQTDITEILLKVALNIMDNPCKVIW
jgi:hypothetical protein